MTQDHRTIRLALTLLAMLSFASAARATQIQDLVRIKGQEGSKLVGTGLIVGLPGTGDGKSVSVNRQIAELLKRTSDPNALATEMKDLKNVALVTLTVNVPPSGVREGDKLDVHVSSIGGAKSLSGGRLFLSQLLGPLRGMGIYAQAEGPVTVEGEDIATVGVIKGGAQMVRDVTTHCIQDGKLTLVLNNAVATWSVAAELASLINGVMAPEGPELATAIDPKNVVIEVPSYEQAKPGTFISTILTAYVDSDMVNTGTGAVVVVNEKTGQIIVGADVEISPVLVHVNGLAIRVDAPAEEPGGAAPTEPQVPQAGPFAKIDPQRRAGAKLSDLMTALNQLNVEPRDCIEAIRAIHKSGKLYARLIEE